VLEQEVALEHKGVGGAPGMDQEGFDADEIFTTVQQQSFAPDGWLTDHSSSRRRLQVPS
jgi:hypothetical protein